MTSESDSLSASDTDSSRVQVPDSASQSSESKQGEAQFAALRRLEARLLNTEGQLEGLRSLVDELLAAEAKRKRAALWLRIGILFSMVAAYLYLRSRG